MAASNMKWVNGLPLPWANIGTGVQQDSISDPRFISHLHCTKNEEIFIFRAMLFWRIN